MLHSTKGIVLKTVNYSETSVIATVYTAQLGRQTYMINGVRSTKKSRTKAALLQPLTLLDMVVYHRMNKNLQRIKEIKLAQTFVSIPFDLVKSTIALFITELLYKTVKEEEANPLLFDFLYQFIVHLDTTKEAVGNIPLLFLVQLSSHLGFFPFLNFDTQSSPPLTIFDLQEGVFVSQTPNHEHYLALPHSQHLATLLQLATAQQHYLLLSKLNRRFLLQALITYYRFHVEGFTKMKSVHILEEVLA